MVNEINESKAHGHGVRDLIVQEHVFDLPVIKKVMELLPVLEKESRKTLGIFVHGLIKAIKIVCYIRAFISQVVAEYVIPSSKAYRSRKSVSRSYQPEVLQREPRTGRSHRPDISRRFRVYHLTGCFFRFP